MPYKYTGRAKELYLPSHPDKVYKKGDTVPISKADALNLIEQSNMHSFELVGSDEDLLDTVTKPIDEEPKFVSTPVANMSDKEKKGDK